MNVGHRELSVILYDKLKEHGKNSNSVRGLKFRREIKKKNKNCYQKVLELNEKDRREIIDNAIANGVLLGGGIGDHIEEMSRIIPWMVHESVQIPLCSTLTRVEQLKELNTKCKWMVNCSEAVNSKLFLAALGDELPETKDLLIDKNSGKQQ